MFEIFIDNNLMLVMKAAAVMQIFQRKQYIRAYYNLFLTIPLCNGCQHYHQATAIELAT